MSKLNELFTLPAGPAELCFDKNEFMKTSFSVDDFLHENRNAGSLEGIRDDLGLYLKVLRSAMIELINEDYADFVNLSANLIGLDQSINKIRKPLDSLKDEVLSVQQTLKDTMNEVMECLDEKNHIRNEKHRKKCYENFEKSLNKLSHLLNLLNSNDTILERIALQTIQLNFNQKFCIEFITNEQNVLSYELHSKLLIQLKSFFIDSLKNGNEKNIDRCLKIYSNIDEIKIAEDIVKTDILNPLLNSIISEVNLQNHPNGLQGIYNQILEIVSSKLSLLIKLTKKHDQFDFVLNCYWYEVERRLETNMASIFAPGNPELFYQKYTQTLGFLLEIEKLIATDKDIIKFRSSDNYKNFQTRWNLPVYFQIRFQEIGGSMESACNKIINKSILTTSNDFKLLPFFVAWNCILKCWKKGNFLVQLFMKFWKLTLQILSRLSKWIDSVVVENMEITDFSKNDFFVDIYVDVVTMQHKLPEILKLVKQNCSTTILTNTDLLEACLNETSIMFDKKLKLLENVFLQDLILLSQTFIKHVNDIPRLYRKTNKDVPSKPCGYIEQLIIPSKNFKSNYSKKIDNDKIQNLLRRVFCSLTKQYYNAVDEVLISVQKTEESLRRLKNLRERTPTQSAETKSDRVMTDDDKIRLQLQVDVTHWVAEINKLGMQSNDIHQLTDLLHLVESATKFKLTDEK